MDVNRLEYLWMRFGGIDRLLDFFCFAVLAAVIGTLAGRWAKDRLKPRRSVPARFTARRSEVCRHKTSRGESTTVHFYATFETEDGESMEFSVSDDEYGRLVWGERGTLRYQGARYLGFEQE